MKKQVVDNIAIYMRLSSDDGEDTESESIGNQRKINYEFINKYFEYKKCYEYVDDGYSGTNFNRPDFQRMLKELKKNKIELIVTKSLSRFARNYIDSGDYIEKKFPDMGIRYIAVLDGVDNFYDKTENEFAPFKGLFNEMFCRETSKNIRRTKKKKREEGFYSCPIPPYGYKKDPDNPGKLIIDYEVAHIVKEIFMMKYEGKTAKAIAKYLNEKNIPPPAKYLNIFKNRNIEIWTGENVTRLLTKPVYVGDTYMGKAQNLSYKSKKKIYNKREECVITRNTHEPIISREIFDAIHDNNKYNNYKPKIPNVDTKLGDLIFCKCKRNIRKVNKNGKIFLFCGAYQSSEQFCTNSTRYKYIDIEDIVLETLRVEVDDFLNSKYRKDNIYKKYAEQRLRPIKNKEKELEKEKKNVMFKISALYNERLDKKISENEYQNKYKVLIDERNRIDKSLEENSNNEQIIENEGKLKDDLKKIKKAYRNLSLEKFTKEDLKALIKRITLSGKEIKIEYTFNEKSVLHYNK